VDGCYWSMKKHRRRTPSVVPAQVPVHVTTRVADTTQKSVRE
jgi:hypothetical protein